MTTLREVNDGDRELIRNLFNLMYAEQAQFTREIGDMDERGYFDYSASDAYFSGEDSAKCFVIMQDDRIAGMACMTSAPFVKPGCDYCLQELYILTHMRSNGIGSAACASLLRKYPGYWCCVSLINNVRGMKFVKDVLIADCNLLAYGQLDDESMFFEFET